MPTVVSEKEYGSKPYFQQGGHDFYIEKYIPYAKANIKWLPNEEGMRPSRFLSLSLKNKFAEQDVVLNSLDYDSTFATLGPLTVTLFEKLPSKC